MVVLENTYLCAVAGKVTQQASAQETKVGSLATNIGPLRAPETSNARPVVRLKLPHSMQQDIQRYTEELMPDNDVGVGPMQGH